MEFVLIRRKDDLWGTIRLSSAAGELICALKLRANTLYKNLKVVLKYGLQRPDVANQAKGLVECSALTVTSDKREPLERFRRVLGLLQETVILFASFKGVIFTLSLWWIFFKFYTWFVYKVTKVTHVRNWGKWKALSTLQQTNKFIANDSDFGIKGRFARNLFAVSLSDRKIDTRNIK